MPWSHNKLHHILALLFSLVFRYHRWLCEFRIETRRHVLCTCITHLDTCLTLFSTEVSLIDEYLGQWKWIYAHILALLFSLVFRYHCWLCEFRIETRRHVLCTCITHLDTCLTLFSTEVSLIDEYHSQWEWIYAHILALLFSLVFRYHCWLCEFRIETRRHVLCMCITHLDTCLTLFSTAVSLIDEYHSQWEWIYAHAHTCDANLISVSLSLLILRNLTS